MGIVGWSLIGFGGECSGIVRAVGPDVKNLTVGDRVVTLASWTFSTRVAASEKVCVKIPDDLSLENAATMASVYSTVIHGLIDLGQLHRGSVSSLEGTSGLSNNL
jgi:NADPH:quinone reductase-like Zn-dependent oxidoreductase